MKKVLLAISFALIFIACSSNDIEPKKETPVIKDFALTFSDSLDYSSIPWDTTALNVDTVFVINSQEEFAKNFPTATAKPDNFTDYSLLFAYGTTTNKIVKTTHKVVAETGGTYRMDVDIELEEEQIPDVWCVTVLVPKIPDASVVPFQKTLSGAGAETPPETPTDDPNPGDGEDE
jgi:hypothetical protein